MIVKTVIDEAASVTGGAAAISSNSCIRWSLMVVMSNLVIFYYVVGECKKRKINMVSLIEVVKTDFIKRALRALIYLISSTLFILINLSNKELFESGTLNFNRGLV